MDIDVSILKMKKKLQMLLDAEFRSFKIKYKDLKVKGVYVIYEGDEILYIGESMNLHQRLYQNLLNGDEQAHTLIRHLWGYKEIETKDDVREFLKNQCRYKILETINRKRLEDFASSVINPKFYGNKRISKKKKALK